MLYVVHTDEQVVVRSTVQSVQYMYHLRRCIVRSIHEMDVVHTCTYIQVQQVLCMSTQTKKPNGHCPNGNEQWCATTTPMFFYICVIYITVLVILTRKRKNTKKNFNTSNIKCVVSCITTEYTVHTYNCIHTCIMYVYNIWHTHIHTTYMYTYM